MKLSLVFPFIRDIYVSLQAVITLLL